MSKCIICKDDYYESLGEPPDYCSCGEMAWGDNAYDWDGWKGVRKLICWKLTNFLFNLSNKIYDIGFKEKDGQQRKNP